MIVAEDLCDTKEREAILNDLVAVEHLVKAFIQGSNAILPISGA